MRVITVILLLISQLAKADPCVIRSMGIHEELQHVSMIELIANGEKYDQLPISLIGLLKKDYVNLFRVYPSEKAIDYLILSEGIRVGLTKEQFNEYSHSIQKLDGQYVSLVGYFNSVKRRDAGSIEKIEFLCRAETRQEREKMLDNLSRKVGAKSKQKIDANDT